MSTQIPPKWTDPPLSWRTISGSSVAIIDQNDSVTYAELRIKVLSAVGALRRTLDACDQPVIAIAIPLGLDFTIALLSSLDTGALIVPLDSGLPSERMHEILRDAQPNLIIASEETLPQIQSMQPDWKALTLRDLIETNQQVPVHPTPSDWRGVLLYTSGTTGNPKGVLVPGEMLIREARTLIDRIGIIQQDRISHMLSPSVIGGLREIFSALLSGGVLVPFRIKELGLSKLIQQMESQKISICRLVSTMFRSICYALPTNHSLKIRHLYIGGEPLTGSDIALFRKHFTAPCQLSNVFGATEFGLCTHYKVPTEIALSDFSNVPIGTANEGYELSVLDQDGNEVPRGQAGCLAVAGECIAAGYWNSSERCVEPFEQIPSRIGWRKFRTSDIVRINESEQFEYLGRSDSQVKINGNRIELAGIENILRRAKNVQDAVVVNLEVDGRTNLYAMVQRKTDKNQDLILWCKEHLPEPSIPQYILKCSSIPRTFQGKCDRKAVRRILQEHLAQSTQSLEGSERTERITSHRAETIAKLWRQANRVPNNEPVKRTSVFHADSLSKLEFLINVRNQLGFEIKPSELFSGITLKEFEQVIDGKSETAGDRSESKCLRLNEQFSGPALFLLHGASGETGVYRFLVQAWQPKISLYGVNADREELLSKKPLNFSFVIESAIRSILIQQPNGPYLLAGYSYGGVLAYEIALEMTKRGHHVAYCGLIDSFLPIHIRYPKSLHRYLAIPYNLPRWFADTLCSNTIRTTWARLNAKKTAPIQRLAGLPNIPDAIKELVTTLLLACDQHKPSKGSLPTWFYRAKVRPLLHSHRVEREWEHHTSASFQVRTIPGNHSTIMNPRYVHELAQSMAVDVQKALTEN